MTFFSQHDMLNYLAWHSVLLLGSLLQQAAAPFICSPVLPYCVHSPALALCLPGSSVPQAERQEHSDHALFDLQALPAPCAYTLSAYWICIPPDLLPGRMYHALACMLYYMKCNRAQCVLHAVKHAWQSRVHSKQYPTFWKMHWVADFASSALAAFVSRVSSFLLQP